MKTILFTDLDDTLFSTARKQPIDDTSVLASVLKDNTPSGWQNQKQQAFLDLWESAIVIPVTARNTDAFSRVQLSFSHGAVINHGGAILMEDRSYDTHWHSQQKAHSDITKAWLKAQKECLESIAKTMGVPVNARIISDFDLDLYALLKSPEANDDAVARIAHIYEQEYANDSVGYVHCNSNNLAILPHWLGKKNAVEYLKEKLIHQYGNILTIGCGDSLSDVPFMQACDFWIAPQTSQVSTYFNTNGPQT